MANALKVQTFFGVLAAKITAQHLHLCFHLIVHFPSVWSLLVTQLYMQQIHIRKLVPSRILYSSRKDEHIDTDPILSIIDLLSDPNAEFNFLFNLHRKKIMLTIFVKLPQNMYVRCEVSLKLNCKWNIYTRNLFRSSWIEFERFRIKVNYFKYSIQQFICKIAWF